MSLVLHLHLHLSDAFIQSDLQLHSGYTFLISIYHQFKPERGTESRDRHRDDARMYLQ